ncbi:helix-turn-helix transcriptional regulator [bacterium]|nr:helix-turn-helix transcriptional regulator [bacterium]
MDSVKILLGKRIKELRDERGWTQEVFAEKSVLDVTTISNIENGKNYPNSITIEKIARTFDVQLHELYIFEHLQKPDFNILLQEMNEAFLDNPELVYKMYNVFKVINF